MAMQLYKGWPYDGTINDNLPCKDSEGVVCGMAVKKEAGTGKAIKAVGASDEVIYFAMQSQAAPDVTFANSLPVLASNYIVYTDQFVTASFALDDKLEIGDGAEAGLWKKHSGGGKPVAGRYDGTGTFDGVSMIRIKVFA